jgi:hypothetical protein
MWCREDSTEGTGPPLPMNQRTVKNDGQRGGTGGAGRTWKASLAMLRIWSLFQTMESGWQILRRRVSDWHCQCVFRWSVFCHFDEIPGIKSQEEMIVLTHSFRGFSPLSLELYCLWASDEAVHCGRSMWWSKAAHLMVARKQNQNQKHQDEASVPISPSMAHLQWPNFFPLGPTS